MEGKLTGFADRPHVQADIPRPEDTRIVLQPKDDGDFAFHLPRRKLSYRDLARFWYLTLWIVLIVIVALVPDIVSTWAKVAAWVALLPSLSLWAVFSNAAYERQTISVADERIMIRKKRLFRSKDRTIGFSEVDKIGVAHILPGHPLRGFPNLKGIDEGAREGRFVRVPTLVCGSRRIRFAEYVSLEEMEWIVNVIKAHMGD